MLPRSQRRTAPRPHAIPQTRRHTSRQGRQRSATPARAVEVGQLWRGERWRVAWVTQVAFELIEDPLYPADHPLAWPAAAALPAADAALVQPDLDRELGLAEAEPAARGPQADAEGRTGLFWVVAEESHDTPVVPRKGDGQPILPEPDLLLTRTKLCRDGSLRQAEVEPSATGVVAERLDLNRITSWKHARFGASEPEAGKRQRNGEVVSTR